MSSNNDRPTTRGSSRFQEGSMNDRVSAVPPPNFLGLGGSPHAISEPNLQSSKRNSAPAGPVNVAAQPEQPSTKRSFFAPLWDGVRRGLNLTRSKSSSTISSKGSSSSREKRNSKDMEKEKDKIKLKGNKKSKPQLQQQQQQNHPYGNVDVQLNGTGQGRPTREEIMINYQDLVNAGFFSSHAIQSSRHAAPHQKQQQQQQQKNPHHHHQSLPLPPLERPLESDLSFASRMAATRRPSTSRGPKYASDASLTAPRHTPTQDTDMSSPQRGTKRGRADDEGATGNEGAAADGPARKLARKIRKSSSRVNVEPPSRTPSATHRPGATASNSSRPARVPLSAAKPSKASSNTAVLPAAAAKTSEKHRAIRSKRSTSSITSVSSTKKAAKKAAKQQQRSRRDHRDRARSPAADAPGPARRPLGSRATPPPQAHRIYSQGQNPVISPRSSSDVPSFHYPQRTRTPRFVDSSPVPSSPQQHHQRQQPVPVPVPVSVPQALSARPSANRGIPTVPLIPREFKFQQHRQSVGDFDVENILPVQGSREGSWCEDVL